MKAFVEYLSEARCSRLIYRSRGITSYRSPYAQVGVQGLNNGKWNKFVSINQLFFILVMKELGVCLAFVQQYLPSVTRFTCESPESDSDLISCPALTSCLLAGSLFQNSVWDYFSLILKSMIIKQVLVYIIYLSLYINTTTDTCI